MFIPKMFFQILFYERKCYYFRSENIYLEVFTKEIPTTMITGTEISWSL